jgi:hypothetical protein
MSVKLKKMEMAELSGKMEDIAKTYDMSIKDYSLICTVVALLEDYYWHGGVHIDAEHKPAGG